MPLKRNFDGFDISICQSNWEISSNLCGLLRNTYDVIRIWSLVSKLVEGLQIWGLKWVMFWREGGGDILINPLLCYKVGLLWEKMYDCMIFWVADFVIHSTYFFKRRTKFKSIFFTSGKNLYRFEESSNFGSNLTCRHDERKILLNLALP